MASYEYMLQYVMFRILNVPFYFMGYSSLITLLSVMTSLWTAGWLMEDTAHVSKATQRDFDFIVGVY